MLLERMPHPHALHTMWGAEEPPQQLGCGLNPGWGAEGQWVTSKKVTAWWQRCSPVSPGWWFGFGVQGVMEHPQHPMGGYKDSTNVALTTQTPLGSVTFVVSPHCPCVPAPLAAAWAV